MFSAPFRGSIIAINKKTKYTYIGYGPMVLCLRELEDLHRTGRSYLRWSLVSDRYCMRVMTDFIVFRDRTLCQSWVGLDIKKVLA